MPSSRSAAGITLVEVILAITLLTVGLLGLATATALVTRMVAQGRRTTAASLFAVQRLEWLRAAACVAGAAVQAGRETVQRGTVVVMSNSWRFSPLGDRTWQIELTTSYPGHRGARSMVTESAVVC